MKNADVSRVTAEFIRQLSGLMAEAGYATIDGFGTLKVEVVQLGKEVRLPIGGFHKGIRQGSSRRIDVPSYLRVHFSKAKKLKELLDEAFKEQ